ncbi:MAG: hypothetical protein IKA36_00155 [Clostridia bacterium]|nr:hypothetical protein [Clostridia bacterium]
MAISLQSGIRDYNGDLSKYTGILGGLTPDIHTLRSLNPLTTNRVICVMYRGPYFLMHYFGDGSNAYTNRPFATYKKLIEYYNMGIQVNMNDATLGMSQGLQGGFAGRSFNVPTTQNAQTGQTLRITVPELVGRPVSNFHNMWIDGIADPITGLTTYHGLVAGSYKDGTPQRIFSPPDGGSDMALEPSPAWEVAEFLIIALDRSGARVEAATMALGCIPQNKIGNEIFQHNNNGQSDIQKLELTFSCQYVQSAYVNDLATRYVQQFAVFGNSLNFNPGAGDAFFKNENGNVSDTIDTAMFNNGKRPVLDGVQSGVGNAPAFRANNQSVTREGFAHEHTIVPADHSRIWNQPKTGTVTSIADPYNTNVVNPG